MERSLAKSAVLAIAVLLAGTVSAAAQRVPIDTAPDPDELREEIRLTVLHEIAHYFGMDEEEIEDLGY